MPYKVLFEKENKIIYIEVSGIVEREEHYKAGDEALKIYKEINAKRLLVNLSELKIEKSSTTRCFNFGKLVAKSFPNACIAHVLPRDLYSRKDVYFISNVASNRGRITAEFENIDDAREWLQKK